MSLYFLGDIHGNPYPSLSFKNNPHLRKLTSDDVIVQLGDFGVPFTPQDLNGYADSVFKWIDSQKYTFIVVGGNHENYDYWETCPIVDIFGGKARKATTNKGEYNIYFIDFPTVLTIDNKKLLCLPKGNSHDIDNLLNPKDNDYKQKKRALNKRLRDGDWSAHYRIIGQTWWPQEKIDIEKYEEFVDSVSDNYFDFICSHITPSFVAYAFGFRTTNEGENYFERVFDNVNFGVWVHGHLHSEYYSSVSDMCGLYSHVRKSDELMWSEKNR